MEVKCRCAVLRLDVWHVDSHMGLLPLLPQSFEVGKSLPMGLSGEPLLPSRFLCSVPGISVRMNRGCRLWPLGFR